MNYVNRIKDQLTGLKAQLSEKEQVITANCMVSCVFLATFRVLIIGLFVAHIYSTVDA
jgi:hypothetical protein